MAKPNKTVAAYRAKVGPKPEVVAARLERMKNTPSYKIMDAVSNGEMTVEEGVAAIKRLLGETE